MHNMKSKKIVCFGELMLRLEEEGQQLDNVNLDTAIFVGSEANVGVSLATLGDNVWMVTRLPDNVVGHTAAKKLQDFGVNTDLIMFEGDRIGTYFLQQGQSRQKSKTIYDRDNTPFSTLKPGDIDWHSILKDADIFHTTGISIGISQSAADVTFEALDVADELGLTISIDINYRSALWKYGADAHETITRLMQRADVMFGDAIEYEWLTGRRVPLEVTSADDPLDLATYEDWYKELHEICPRCGKMIIGTRNQVAPTHHLLTALMLSDGNKMLHSVIHDITNVIDPVGVGDAFAAGSIHAALNFPDDPQKWLDYSLAAATLKNYIPGDFNLAKDEEILDLIAHPNSSKGRE